MIGEADKYPYYPPYDNEVTIYEGSKVKVKCY